LELARPSVWLVLAGTLVLCSSLVVRSPSHRDVAAHRRWFALLTLGIALVGFLLTLAAPAVGSVAPSGLLRWDATAAACQRLAWLGGALIVLLGWSAAPRGHLPEYYGSLLLLLAGMTIAGSANDLIVLYLGLELVSISTYVMLAVAKGDNAGQEATLKYFLLSVFSSCVFLLGASYLYGLVGSTDLGAITDAARESPSHVGRLAIVLVLSGLAFRITAPPFHFYASDVFAGTTWSLTAVLSYLPKVVGFVALVRLVGEVGGASSDGFVTTVVLVLAAVAMCVGNIMGLVQTDVRRLFAYSSIAHSGYMLLALAVTVDQPDHNPAVLYSYLAAYAAMTLGALACLAAVAPAPREIRDLAGLAGRQPLVAALLVVALVSLMGLPLTAGFWAKLQIFVAALATGQAMMQGAAVLMAINAAVAIAYYWRIAEALFAQPVGGATGARGHWAPAVCALAAAGLTVVWFLAPALM